MQNVVTKNVVTQNDIMLNVVTQNDVMLNVVTRMTFSYPQILDLDGFQVSFFDIFSDVFDVGRRRQTTDGKADRSFGSVQAESAFDEDRRAA
jgi:hypothetical protein